MIDDVEQHWFDMVKCRRDDAFFYGLTPDEQRAWSGRLANHYARQLVRWEAAERLAKRRSHRISAAYLVVMLLIVWWSHAH